MRKLAWGPALLIIWGLLAQAQQSPGILTQTELKKVVPDSYFFQGLSAPVQRRNSAAVRLENGKLVVGALMDTSGFSSDAREKCEGLLITETKVEIEGTSLPTGAYGFGFTKEGKLNVFDVGGEPVISVTAKTDEALRPAVPLTMKEHDGETRLYRGRNYVTIKGG